MRCSAQIWSCHKAFLILIWTWSCSIRQRNFFVRRLVWFYPPLFFLTRRKSLVTWNGSSLCVRSPAIASAEQKFSWRKQIMIFPAFLVLSDKILTLVMTTQDQSPKRNLLCKKVLSFFARMHCSNFSPLFFFFCCKSHFQTILAPSPTPSFLHPNLQFPGVPQIITDLTIKSEFANVWVAIPFKAAKSFCFRKRSLWETKRLAIKGEPLSFCTLNEQKVIRWCTTLLVIISVLPYSIGWDQPLNKVWKLLFSKLSQDAASLTL